MVHLLVIACSTGVLRGFLLAWELRHQQPRRFSCFTLFTAIYVTRMAVVVHGGHAKFIMLFSVCDFPSVILGRLIPGDGGIRLIPEDSAQTLIGTGEPQHWRLRGEVVR